jgi:hypothetical protein
MGWMLLSTRDTDEGETPARLATSTTVGFFAAVSFRSVSAVGFSEATPHHTGTGSLNQHRTRDESRFFMK